MSESRQVRPDRPLVRRTEKAELGCLTDVAMVQTADFGELHDPPCRENLDRPEIGCVLVQREVRSRLMVIDEIAGHDAVQVPRVDDEHVIQTLAPDRADEPLRERVLPRALRRREHFVDAHALYAMPELLTVDLVTIPEEIGGSGIVREGVDELLGRPGGGGMLGDVEVDDAPAVVSEHDENEEDTEASSGYGEEVD